MRTLRDFEMQAKQLVPTFVLIPMSLATIAVLIWGGLSSQSEVLAYDFPATPQVAEQAEQTDGDAKPQASQAGEESVLGIVKQKPSDGPSVEVPGGFMVPYKTKIPGTDIEFTMLPIAGGEFTMGSPQDEEDRRDDEGPQFKVTVQPFWMGKHEVTWAEYTRYMQMDKVFKALQAKGLRVVTAENEIDAVTAPSSLYDPSFTYSSGEDPSQPAATMTQFAAKQYTKWLSLTSKSFYRLPTEAEWEYACRAGTTTAFYFGDDPDELEKHAWTYETSDDERHTVGQLKPNPWGLYDMYGNVAEWVLDQYDENGYTHVEAGASVTAEKAFRKPTKLFPRVVRGGSFEMELEDFRSAARMGSDDKEWKNGDPCFPTSPWWYTDMPATGVGFRLMRPLKTPDVKSRGVFWDADIESVKNDSQGRVDNEGRGAKAVVDPGLAKDISELTDKDR